MTCADRKYEDSDAAALKQVEADWEEEYSKGEAADAKVKRRYTVGVLTGSVTPFWSTLQAILTHDPEINQAESVLQVRCRHICRQCQTAGAGAGAAVVFVCISFIARIYGLAVSSFASLGCTWAPGIRSLGRPCGAAYWWADRRCEVACSSR